MTAPRTLSAPATPARPTLAVILLLVGLLAACSSGSTGAAGTASASGAGAVAAPGRSAGGGEAAAAPVAGRPAGSALSSAASGSTGSAGSSGGSSSIGPTAAPRLVRTGSIALVVKEPVAAVVDQLGAAAAGLGGYTSASTSSSDGDSSSGSGGGAGTASVTLRVPAGAFDKLRAAVAKVGRPETSTTSSTDVTSQYVDLEARLTALRATRGTYLTMLTRSSTIGDTLAVQQRIDDLQVQIEQIEGQRQVLADQSDLATLTVAIREQGAPTTGIKRHPGGFSGAWHRSWSRFAHGLQAIVAALGPLALVALILLVLAGGGIALWSLIRVVRRRLARDLTT